MHIDYRKPENVRLAEFLDQVYKDVVRVWHGHTMVDAQPIKLKHLNAKYGIRSRAEFSKSLRDLMENDQRFFVWQKQDLGCLIAPRSEIDAMFNGDKIAERRFFDHF